MKIKNIRGYYIALSRSLILWEKLFFLFFTFHLNAQVTISGENNIVFTGNAYIYKSQKNDNVASQKLSSKEECVIYYNNVLISGQSNFHYVNDDGIILDKNLLETNENTKNLLAKNNDSEEIEYLTNQKLNSPEDIVVDFNDKSSSYFLILAAQSNNLLPNKENKYGLLNPLYKKQEVINNYDFLLIDCYKKRFQNITNRHLFTRPPPVLHG